MAASIYATPPPDLSSEDTALSDVSNSSTLNTNRGGGGGGGSNSSSSSNNHTTTSNNNNNNNHSNNNNNNNTHEATVTATTNAATSNQTTAAATTTTAAMSPQLDTESKSKSPTLQQATQLGSNTTEADDDDEPEADAEEGGELDQTAMAAMAAAAANAAAMQLQLLEALNDAAKKRRKQHNPSRLEALNLSGGEGETEAEATAAVAAAVAAGETSDATSNAVIDYEEKLSKMLLPKSIVKLKQTFELLQQQKLQPADISEEEKQQQQQQQEQVEQQQQQQHAMLNPYQTYCKQCGENFETEFKLSLHMLQDHQQQQSPPQQQPQSGEQPLELLNSFKVKLERADSPTQLELQQQQEQLQQQQQQQHQQQQQQLELANGHAGSNKEHELWLQAMAQQQQQQQQQQSALPGMPPGFGFPPEAAALGWPLLGMPGFTGVEGLNRPPLRIFNPEAYCELCNKEFCNKYFLKTHKANKHGIFDPAGDLSAPGNNSLGNLNNNNSLSNNNSSSMSTNNSSNSNSNSNNNSSNSSGGATSMFQQLQVPREQQPQKPEPQLTPPAPPTVHCDICSKRFTNVFAMRRHRAKQHESAAAAATAGTAAPSPTLQQRRGSPNESQAPVKLEPLLDAPLPAEAKPYQLPEGFREDFTLEQEELPFAPQPRKLPPQLQQQARDANCAPEKLRRLGVLLPEAFCELCCKEYANRYFLRTHKWKRHGVFVPPDDLQLSGKEEQQPLMSAGWPFMPLNLMLAKAAADQEQQQQQEQQLTEAEPEQQQLEEELQSEEQPSKRIKLEPYEESMPESKADNNSVMGLQNLQKLQSMLQQLNDFNGKRPLPCHLCGRELEHQYALRAHLMTEHAGQLLPEGHPMLYQQQQQQQQQQLPLKLSPLGGAGSPHAAATPTPNELRCLQCERDFATTQEFKQHIAEVHLGRMPGNSPLREGFYTPERATVAAAAAAGVGGGASSGPPRAAYTITPTSSYCEICNKELCNKYFMKTHMQRMHGIEIENGAQIGGVVCNICNKELCSKYFLRVHKHNTHGIIEDGAPLPQPRGQNGVKLEAQQQQLQQQQQQQQQQLMDAEMPLAGDANANNEVCSLCARQFRSFKWLRTHLLNEHGAAGVEKLRELEQPTAATVASAATQNSRSKPNSPTLKIPNGNANVAANNLPANNLAQALQNAQQQLFGQMQGLPKGMPLPLPLPGMFEQTPRFKEYQCSLCPFTTPYYAFLFIHERSHALLNNGGDGDANLAAEAEPPRADRDRSFALVQGKARTKSSRDRSDVVEQHNEPTNLTTTSNNNNNSNNSSNSNSSIKAARTPPTPTVTPTTPHASPELSQANAVSLVESPKQPRSATVTPTPRRSSSKPGTPNGLGAQRSAATSPFENCNDLANGSGKPASYAQPIKAEEAYQMQAFHLAPVDGDAEGVFAPALVYLPVRMRASETTTLSFRLTPA
ncbi:uncharacterized protein LOC132792283 [Drosophila nasuta]|uniref:uncharacterized protein LOC132792283 n=1 Tax=Drosophila nasuta TaxID=42062 RepID=UPI00295E2B03|nr:uncharacterized protein LOC132792283 [Drosophila nasuta]XP_060657558.1 uncharacterized protein LOC132792283 [Drosophila nasuta]